MPLDANGIWQYTETETVSPFHEFMNRLAGSVSSVLGPFVRKTNWLPCTPSPGTTFDSGYAVEARQIGHLVFAEGRMTRAASTSTQTWCTLPAALPKPRRIIEVGDRSTTAGRVFLVTDGTLQSQNTPTSGSVSLYFNLLYVVE